jgi:hypothetical protein
MVGTRSADSIGGRTRMPLTPDVAAAVELVGEALGAV